MRMCERIKIWIFQIFTFTNLQRCLNIYWIHIKMYLNSFTHLPRLEIYYLQKKKNWNLICQPIKQEQLRIKDNRVVSVLTNCTDIIYKKCKMLSTPTTLVSTIHFYWIKRIYMVSYQIYICITLFCFQGRKSESL